MRFIHNCLIFSAFLLICSCASKKGIVYLQDSDSAKESGLPQYEAVLKPDDLLSIIISSETPEATVPFNLPAIQGNYEINNNQNGIKTYLVDNAGFIDFPVIGKTKLGGLSHSDATALIGKKVAEFVKDPSVNLRILNYKISLLGEVNKPGSYVIPGERITLLEALSQAGDLTIYGKRNNILVIREMDGKKTFNRVDITKSGFTNSPFYYLTQNDVVVVEPNKTRVNSSAVGPNVTVIISAASLLISIAVLITR